MRIGIIGSGVSGMTAAWLLQHDHEVVLLEKAARLGGHAETIPVTIGTETIHAEVGARFFFDSAYPHFITLLRLLQVPIRWTDLTVCVHDVPRGQSLALPPRSPRQLARLLAAPRNLLHVGSLRRLIQDQPGVSERRDSALTLRQHLAARGYPPSFGPELAYPFLAACWGTPLELLPEFPVYSLLKGMPSGQRPGTYEIDGGMSRYVAALRDALSRVEVCVDVDVQKISQRGATYVVEDAAGKQRRFDQLIVATSARDAAQLLRGLPAAGELHAAVDAFRHWEIDVAVHGDASFMPPDRRDWAHNNLFFDRDRAWMTDWQGLRGGHPVFRTWLPKGCRVPTPLHAQRRYHHVLMTSATTAQQRRIATAQGAAGLWVTGMYAVDVDNHESALLSALVPARALAPDAPNLRRLLDAVPRDAAHGLEVLPVPLVPPKVVAEPILVAPREARAR